MLHIKHSTSLFYEVLVPSVIFFHEWVGIKQGCEKLILTLLASTPQNDQTQSKNSSATALSVFDIFLGWRLKG